MLSELNVGRNLVDGTMRELNGSYGESLQNELELLHSHDILNEVRADLNINRSGSAPPTVEGSLSAVGSLLRNPNFSIENQNTNAKSNAILSEEEIQSHPAYLSYYYSNENLNPRLPQPFLSREDWRLAQRFQNGGSSCGGISDWVRDKTVNVDDSSSLFSIQPRLSIEEGNNELMEINNNNNNANSRNLSQASSMEWLDSDGFIGLPGGGLGMRRKSFADILQEGLHRPASPLGRLSRPASHSSFSDIVKKPGISNHQISDSYEETINPGLPRVRSFSSAVIHSPVSTPLSRNKRVSLYEKKKNINTGPSALGSRSSSLNELADVASSISRLSFSNNQVTDEDSYVEPQHIVGLDGPNPMLPKKSAVGFSIHNNDYVDTKEKNAIISEQNGSDGPLNFPQSTSSSVNNCTRFSSGFTNSEGPNILYEMAFSSIDFPVQMPSSTLISSRDGKRLSSNQVESEHHFQKINHFGNSYPLERLQTQQNAYIEALLAHRKSQYETLLQKSPSLYNGYYLNPEFSLHIPYEGNETANDIFPSSGPKYHYAKKGRNSHFRRTTVDDDALRSSLLEELKNNKSNSLELVDVVNNVFEFCTDQYGSRFLQLKIETASVEEKAKIFPEIILHAHALMTDVFGNYVIQKFFEHGTESQRKDLVKQLVGHVLPLSLQMYGCRVIQKALEVVDEELQTLLVAELDGSVMKCVHDQNCNHVIQKCIECVPQDRIQFIISSFVGQIVALSTHPYGCRVIQRVLEHCHNTKTKQVILDEIVHSACTLAQDHYGNYVVQHVIQHGKMRERSAIIKKLAGQIVKMSQQKFASNVVEKCLTFGGSEERLLLVNEMLGSTDENEPLQEMMKDPFGNYVVQKMLETCDDQICELILSRIKVHLSTLKRYTYGKHIVTRVEKLIAAGERRGGVPSSYCT